jgi:phytoene synthase
MNKQDVLAYSQAMLQQGSKSFAKAARLFDRSTYETVIFFYAWCRYCDDQIDGQSLGFAAETLSVDEQARRLNDLYNQVAKVYAGSLDVSPAFHALHYVVSRHAIPQVYIIDLLRGFARDVENVTYQTIDDVMLYCYYVAGAVGVVMSYIMGVSDRPTLQRACDLGLAFQLTNIARDVLDDAVTGRCYVPSDWLAETGLRDGDLTAVHNRVKVHAVAVRLVHMAEPYYQSAQTGVRSLPFRSAWAVSSALLIYRAIGQRLIKTGSTAWDQRLHTTSLQKYVYVFKGLILTIRIKYLPFTEIPRHALWTAESLSN